MCVCVCNVSGISTLRVPAPPTFTLLGAAAIVLMHRKESGFLQVDSTMNSILFLLRSK